MRAAIFHENGGPEVVRIEQVARPAPGPGQLLVEVRAAALNHLDLWVRRGIPIETTMPHIGGSDFAGVVVEVGEGVAADRVGERVVVNPGLWCGHCRECARGQESMCERYRIVGEHTDGGFTEFVAVHADRAYRIPDDFSFEEAAALPVSYMTAWRALVSRARLRPGEDVLVIGASGGTALAAVQIARVMGARVFAVTQGAANVQRVRELGADVVYDRATTDWSRAVHADTGRRGVDVVVENVGAATWSGSLRALTRGGRLVTYGATAGPKVELDLRSVFWKQIEVIGTTMASRSEFEDMLRIVFAGRIRPVIDTVMPLDQAREAHGRLEAGGQFGKIILVP
ncbi:zinc-binding dehydrogenase [Longimicrobium terrae]|uniref:NADPH:quinone reductase-like Zn-dependent oxidoreductase n=1 Tax=Longimicrobium terrae TaxID=1639882 RepID=A0A841GNW5_9BACT|nr:zinc-binding dehydrogenase [Longimicrobium terrae]MBB4634098.1 NADPH:quinone reductase-like Zn-dependent oxidoreductase [Longimicrobium terrae]MBB6069012.1 NADPH:quinone reductase-like Zn-dependent oxidoreductase [Longimicrobium terrae]NNC28190.1 zinc-binding dehydrogenase [Longimicrobium terrae]